MAKENSVGTKARAEATRAKILKYAREMFVDKGFAGTSMGKIAAAAGVPHSLVFHHFKNKQNLWIEVKLSIAQIVEKGCEKSSVLPSCDRPLREFLGNLIRQSLSFYRDNPDIVRMISWQRLEYEQQQTPGISLSRESQAWIKAFQHYQEQGEINPNLKPEFVMTLILSIVSSAAMDPNVFIKEPKDEKAYILFCVDGLLKLLRN